MKFAATAALVVVGSLALSASASAAVVCNDEGDCWRVKEKYDYPADVEVNVYDDDWIIDTKKYKWREPGEGRGYWRGGVWVTF